MAHQVQHVVGLVPLEGQLPSHHGMKGDALGAQAPQGMPPLLPPRGSCLCWGACGYHSRAPQVGLLPTVLLAREDLGSCVGHRAAEGAQQRVLEARPVGEAEVCQGRTGGTGKQ